MKLKNDHHHARLIKLTSLATSYLVVAMSEQQPTTGGISNNPIQVCQRFHFELLLQPVQPKTATEALAYRSSN